MNALLLRRWLTDHGPRLIGAVLRGVWQVDARSVALRLAGEEGEKLNLLISACEDYPALALLPPDAPEMRLPAEQGGFCKALRHTLHGSTLIGLEQAGFERSVVMRFYAGDPHPDESADGGGPSRLLERSDPKQIVLELAGRASNAYIISGRGMVVSMLKPQKPGANRQRTIKTGKPLPPPPPLGKFIAAEQDAAALEEELTHLRVNTADPLRELFTRRVAAGEVKLWRRLEPLLPVQHSVDLLYDFIRDFQAGELTSQLFQLGEGLSANDRVLADWRARCNPSGTVRLAPSHDSGETAEQAILEQLGLSERAAEVEQLGLDLMARAEELDADSASARAALTRLQEQHPDWAARIDPLASARDNAGRLVSFAQRLRRAHPRLEQKLTDLRARREARADAPPRPGRDAAPPPDRISVQLERRGVKHLRFTSSDDMPIFCGVSDASNDGLLRHFSNSRHTWLHVRDFSGSHVLILNNGKEVPRRTLEEAAIVAAWHSKGRKEGLAEVSWVPLNRVRKPKGAKPGLVHISGEKVVRVRPELFEQLRAHLQRTRGG